MISKELKKPIDDMALTDLKPLPILPRISNINIPGKAYADLLMVEEFVHAFGHVIDIGIFLWFCKKVMFVLTIC